MDAVQEYIDGIASEHRPLFERVNGLVLEAFPEASPVLSYGMPTYRVAERKLYIGAWQHGVSIYGWSQDRDDGFASRHPTLVSGRGTIRLRPQDAAGIPDDELRGLIRAALEPERTRRRAGPSPVPRESALRVDDMPPERGTDKSAVPGGH
ncbi:iron chaperone [Streptomyces sp. NPDC007172]|uniref:iron chaperone n=1 Tax=unclassified Streptomyces TaxID=2593676 RepID=UPI00369C268F